VTFLLFYLCPFTERIQIDLFAGRGHMAKTERIESLLGLAASFNGNTTGC
jgi:hypothetical protein